MAATRARSVTLSTRVASLSHTRSPNQGLGFRVQDLRIWVKGLGFRVYGLGRPIDERECGIDVTDTGLAKVWGLGLRVKCVGSRV
jgi:hypothetical protein